MKKMKKFLALILSLAMIASLAACGGQTEQAGDSGSESGDGATSTELSFPEKDITIIVPFDAGGGNDIVARVIAKVAMEGGYFQRCQHHCGEPARRRRSHRSGLCCQDR